MVIADTDGDNEGTITFFKSVGFSTRAQHLWLAKTLHRKIKKGVKRDALAVDAEPGIVK